MFPEPPTPREVKDEGGYKRLELLDGEWAQLLKVMRSQPRTAINNALVERLELAERVSLPWREMQWRYAEAWAAVGYAIADQIADGFVATREPEAHEKRELDSMGD